MVVDGTQVQIMVANSVWTEGDVKKEFKDTCQTAFGAQILPLQGTAASHIFHTHAHGLWHACAYDFVMDACLLS